MKMFGELFQEADWKKEKHIPVIECAEKVKAGEFFPLKVIVGKEIPHPNTTEHHISWIAVYFQAEGEKSPFEVGRFDFNAHGESMEGPNKGSVYTGSEVNITMKVMKPGVIYSSSQCNLHGLWSSAKELQLG